ncbi:Protein of unknown function [Butyrivibrio hungatei DSM 14810]|uniref:TOD1/MUCI70 glycosyltransferase-like domain-containing protein n=1 Tax=Butyrivibrio hungatei DSM 14810 TaxID=1121132 RepID=A0A1M7RY36_9FIRM|nr:glycosyltransferase domain-containing protein [Butyrivibrio hungatei]SHN51091.1 Protein of unknown function [Butyrivibrio hungatei DSM 14810]
MNNKHDLSQQEISKINDEYEVCIYGAGIVGENMALHLQSIFGLRIDFFCDKNADKWGKEVIPGIKCISPEALAKKGEVFCFALVGLYYRESVLRELKTYSNIKYIMTYDDLIALDSVIEGVLACDDVLQGTSNKSLEKMELSNFKIPNRHNKQIAVYTCITGGYDEIQLSADKSEIADYYVICDNKAESLNDITSIDAGEIIPKDLMDDTRRNRYCKIMGSHIFADYDYSIYVDGNVKIVGDISRYVGNMNEFGFMSHMHAYEDCIYSEAVRVIINGKDDEYIVKKQMGAYRKEGMPRHYGMLHNAILVRENCNPICRELMENWWKEVLYRSKRDQLSLTYCLWKQGIDIEKIGTLGEDMRKNKDFLWIGRHI